jgi:hypothetical protein
MPEDVDSAASAAPSASSADGDTKRVIRVPYVPDGDARPDSGQEDAPPLPDVNEPEEVATPEEESEAHENADGGDDPPASVAEAVSPAVQAGSDIDDGQMPLPSEEEVERDAAQVEAADEGDGRRPDASETSEPSKRWWEFWRM